MKSIDLRSRDTFLRNRHTAVGQYDTPLLQKQDYSLSDIQFLGFHNTRYKDTTNKDKTIHFFIDDHKFECVWNQPFRYINSLKQYRQVLAPDFSLYSDMPLALQAYNVFRQRWCAAYWQAAGIGVIPTVSWSDSASYRFCFDGIQKGSVVALSTSGVRRQKDRFLPGFFEMCKRIEPEAVICYYKPFEEMRGHCSIIEIEHDSERIRKQGKA